MISDAVQSYLCPANSSSVREIEGRIKTLHLLSHEIPYQLQFDSVVVVFQFVRLKRSVVLWKSDVVDISDKERARMWGLLFDLLDRMSASPLGNEQTRSVTHLIGCLRDLCFQVEEKEITAMESAMLLRCMPLSSDPLHLVQNTITRYVSEWRSNRFCKEIEYFDISKTLPSSYAQRRVTPWGDLRETRDLNWSSFLVLIERVLSIKPMTLECEKHFEFFLSNIPSLSEEKRRSIRSALDGMPGNLTAPDTRQRIRASVQRADDLATEKVLIDKVRTLQRRTVVPPENVQVKYPEKDLGGFPQVQSFLMSTDMEKHISGYGSVIVARKVLKSFQNRLPHGIRSEAGGTAKNSFIHLQKPFVARRQEWLQHYSDKNALKKAQAELKQVQARLRKLPEEDEKQPAKKLKTNHAPGAKPDAKEVINLTGEENVSPTKVLEDVITID